MSITVEGKQEISGGRVVRVIFELPLLSLSEEEKNRRPEYEDLTKKVYSDVAEQLAGYLAILQLSEKKEAAVGTGILKIHLAQAAKEITFLTKASKRYKKK